MTGPAYETALKKRGLERLVPDEATMKLLNAAIFDELCLGIFDLKTTDRFLGGIDDLKSWGTDSVILGCTRYH
jgi:aspartate racemase